MLQAFRDRARLDRTAAESSDRNSLSILSSIAQRENDALRSMEYERALNSFRLVSETYHKARDRREAAVAIIDAWRTQQSDQRAMGRVG